MTSRLETYLSKNLYQTFGHISIRQNYRPEWLTSSKGTRLELDFYLEELKLAAEVQGMQHFVFVNHFHKNYSDFEDQKKRDAEKALQCRKKGVELVEVFTEKDADLFVQRVSELTNTPLIFKKKYKSVPYHQLVEEKKRMENLVVLSGNLPVYSSLEIHNMYLYLASMKNLVLNNRGFFDDGFLAKYANTCVKLKQEIKKPSGATICAHCQKSKNASLRNRIFGPESLKAHVSVKHKNETVQE
jgi:hypothetical protein